LDVKLAITSTWIQDMCQIPRPNKGFQRLHSSDVKLNNTLTTLLLWYFYFT